jgi:redox-sensitive bicupin YhaK (pirin superfamily)
MEIHSLADAPGYSDDRLVAVPFAESTQANARLIRLAPGQVLPPHTHGVSDLFLYAVEGEAVIDTDAGAVPFPGGTLAVLRGQEELRVSNPGPTGATFLAFLAPPFPPRA